MLSCSSSLSLELRQPSNNFLFPVFSDFVVLCLFLFSAPRVECKEVLQQHLASHGAVGGIPTEYPYIEVGRGFDDALTTVHSGLWTCICGPLLPLRWRRPNRQRDLLCVAVQCLELR